MRLLLTLAFFTLLCLPTNNLTAQKAKKQTQEQVLAEGKTLYRLEKAAWIGTDVLRARMPNDLNKVGGYVTYPDGSQTKCTFLTRESVPQALLTVSFDQDFTEENIGIDAEIRPLNQQEKRLSQLRKSAEQHMAQDTIFKTYKNSRLNLVPMIYQGVPKVYVLSGPSVSDLVIFGNDYLIEFDGKDRVKSARTLHQNIILLEVTDNQTETFHSHNKRTGSFMTPTDICTLLLYGKYTPWEKHTVMSHTHWNAWNIEKEQMTVITRKAMKKILKRMEEMEKRKKSN